MKTVIITIISILLLSVIAAMVWDKPYVERSACVGCEDCVSQCPTKAISVTNEKAKIDRDKCIDCKICVRACTYKAIRTPQ